jgi:hypothetical protein
MCQVHRVRQRTILAAAITTVLTVAAPTSFAARSQSQTSSYAGYVNVTISGTNDRYPNPTDGSLAGKGIFRALGAIADHGRALCYRTVKGDLITLRFVTLGRQGTITYVVKIDTLAGTSRWTITSGTKAYKGLRGKGTERENLDFTVSYLMGTVSR